MTVSSGSLTSTTDRQRVLNRYQAESCISLGGEIRFYPGSRIIVVGDEVGMIVRLGLVRVRRMPLQYKQVKTNPKIKPLTLLICSDQKILPEISADLAFPSTCILIPNVPGPIQDPLSSARRYLAQKSGNRCSSAALPSFSIGQFGFPPMCRSGICQVYSAAECPQGAI